MPRYLVERTFSHPAATADAGAVDDEALRARLALAGDDLPGGVRWAGSYVSRDRHRSFCLCDAPSAEAVRRAAEAHGQPVDRITEVEPILPAGSTGD